MGGCRLSGGLAERPRFRLASIMHQAWHADASVTRKAQTLLEKGITGSRGGGATVHVVGFCWHHSRYSPVRVLMSIAQELIVKA